MLLDLGREPTVEELAQKLGVDPFDVVTALDSMKDPISMFEPIYNDGGDTIYLYDQIEDTSLQDKNRDLRMAVENALKDLSSREQYIIDQRFIIGKTQMEIAQELGISQAQISRLEKNAIETVKKQLK